MTEFIVHINKNQILADLSHAEVKQCTKVPPLTVQEAIHTIIPSDEIIDP